MTIYPLTIDIKPDTAVDKLKIILETFVHAYEQAVLTHKSLKTPEAEAEMNEARSMLFFLMMNGKSLSSTAKRKRQPKSVKLATASNTTFSITTAASIPMITSGKFDVPRGPLDAP